MKRLLSLLILAFSLVLLTGCDYKLNTTANGQTAIDRKSIADEIYSKVKDDIERDLREQIYNDLMEQYGSGTVEWERLQDEIYNVLQTAAKANIGVYTLKDNNGELVRSSYGSGVIYRKDNNPEGSQYKYKYYAITNEHVVNGGAGYRVGFEDETTIEATLVGSDETTDIAVISFETSREFQVAELGESSNIKPGTIVLAVGNPKGETLFGTATFGIVSGNDRHLIDENNSVNQFLFYIQHDAAINSGNSGGGLFTLDGKVIGINSIKYVSTSKDDIEGLNFSIPIDLVKEVQRQLIEYGSYDGTVSFGITTSEVGALTRAGRANYNVPDSVTEGILVIEVTEGKSCDGLLQVNDIIIKADGFKCTSSSDLQPYLRNSKIGDSVVLTVIRGGEEIEVTIVFKRTTTK